MKLIKGLLPKVNNDKLILEMIRKILGQAPINITINNYVARKLQPKPQPKKKKDEGQSVLESPPSVKAENFLPK